MLRELPRDEFEIVSPKLELVRLQPRQVLHEAGDTLKSAYFCNMDLCGSRSRFGRARLTSAGQ